MKKVLIITYYWPPAGGPGVQRVLKFVKYLPLFGWQPIVLTVNNGEYPAIDETLLNDIPENCIIYKTSSLEPNQIYKKFVGLKETDKIPNAVVTEKNLSWKKKLANFIRLNFFIPDAKILWKPIAVHRGKEIIRKEKPDLIFSSSPPPTVHLIAKKLSRWSGLKWIADFRDPWTDMYYYSAVKKSPHTKMIEKHLELSVLKATDKIVTVSQQIVSLFQSKINRLENIAIIPNGFDLDDFQTISKEKKSSKFTIAYAGKLSHQQNPVNLWQALANLVEHNTEFAANTELLFMGNFSPTVLTSLREYGLDKILTNLGYVDHKEMLAKLQTADILLLVIPQSEKNKGILTGKVFEYLGLQKYILGIGPEDGDVAQIFKQTSSGKMFGYSASPEQEILSRFQNRNAEHSGIKNRKSIEKYSRKNLTQKLVSLFES